MADKNKWTILLYMSTDNSLSEEGVYTLKELKKVAAADVQVFAQFDPVGRGNKTRRFLIRSADPSGILTEECDQFGRDLGETDMSDPETLRRFLVAGVREFSDTTHFMLSLIGHGGGISEGFFLRDEERRLSDIPSAFPLADLKKRVFDDDELLNELDGRKFNVLGFDSCLMSMVEVCYEIRDCNALEYVVASEGFTLNSGWPYHQVVSKLSKLTGKKVEPLDLAKLIVGEYANFYADYHFGGLSTDISVVDLKRIRPLTDRIGELADALVHKFEEEIDMTPDETEELPGDIQAGKLFYKLAGKPFQDSIILAHWAAQSYNGEQSIDLYDFCLMLQKRAHAFEGDDFKKNPESIYNYCKRVMDEIYNEETDHVVDLTCDNGAAFQFSHGVSISLPWSRVNIPPNYPTLRFSSEVPGWVRFINAYVDATQRLPHQSQPQSRLRSTPPYSKGPEGRILSMRNHPTQFVEQECEATKTKSR
jgi:hypothetical protein